MLKLPGDLLMQASEFVSETLGLYFPKERWNDLQRGIASASREFDFKRPEDCIRWLTSSSLQKKEIEILASHLTVGETYFFREKKSFQLLEERILPEIIRSREKHGRHLRIWSAGCCTGEEPYSIAILLHKLIPDLSEWNVTLLATDINPNFLEKAETGIYGEWSFRETPSWVKEKYFLKTKNGKYEILPQIKRLVVFSYLNLAEDAYPSLLNNTNAMDLIFCRNVLMYFNPARAHKTVRNFCRALLDGGWVFVGSGEVSHAHFLPFVAMNFPEVTCYRKDNNAKEKVQDFRPQEFSSTLNALETPVEFTPSKDVRVEMTQVFPFAHDAGSDPTLSFYEEALILYEKGRYEAAGKHLLISLSQGAGDAESMALLSRVYANLGKLDEALSWCETAIAADKLVPAFHYLKAIILQEQNQTEEAVASLRRALYLDTHFVLAHFSLGNLTRQIGRPKESQKHYENALSLLNGWQVEDILPESDGMTAGRLMEIIQNREQGAGSGYAEHENGVRPLHSDF